MLALGLVIMYAAYWHRLAALLVRAADTQHVEQSEYVTIDGLVLRISTAVRAVAIPALVLVEVIQTKFSVTLLALNTLVKNILAEAASYGLFDCAQKLAFFNSIKREIVFCAFHLSAFS